MADTENIRYRTASFSEHNFVELADGSFIPISELRVKGRLGLDAIPTEKDLKNPKTEFTKSGTEVTLKSRQVYEQYQQTSFVVFSSAKGSSSVKDPATLNATIYDATVKTKLPVVVNYGSEKKEKFVPVDRIFELKTEDGHAVYVEVGSISKLLTKIGAGHNDFYVLDDDDEYRPLEKFTAEMLDKIERTPDKYEAEDGQYVFVRLKGDSAHTPCPIEHLRLDDGSGKPKSEKLTLKDLSGCVGKKIWALGEDGKTPYELEPLTEGEIVPYVTRKAYYETFSDADVCKDETDPSKPQATAMLRLKNGKYVKEADVVQPKCYNFVDGSATTNYDAYVVTVGSGEFERSYVVEKSRIDTASGDIVKLAVGSENIEFKKDKAKKVVKSKGGINNSDVVQTTSTKGARAEKCEVLNTRKDKVKLLEDTLNDETKQRLAQRIKKLYAEFLEKYKARQYDLGGELLIQDNPKVDGEFEEYLENHRYMFSDIIPIQDSAVNNLKELLNMPDGGFTFDGEKLTGGSKYDYNKGVKNSFSKWGDGMAYALGFTFSAGGALASLVSPFLLAGLAVGMIGWGIGIPIYHAVKKRQVEAKKDYEYKNKNEYQSETIKDEIFAQISLIIERFKDSQPDFEKSLTGLSPEARTQKIEARKQLLLAEIALEETKIDLLSSSKSGAQFSMEDGKGKVTQANAHEYSRYVKLLGERKAEIENLSKVINETAEKIKKLEDAKSLTPLEQGELANLRTQRQAAIDSLAVKNNEFQDIRKTYRITGTDNHPDKEQQAIRDRIDQAKGFLLVKYFGESVFDEEGKDLTLTEQIEKRQIEEYIKATEIIVDKHKHDFEYVREATKDKTKKVSRREWKRRNKTIKIGTLFFKLRGKGKAAKSATTSVPTASAIEAISEMRVARTEETADVAADVAPEVVAAADAAVPTPPKSKRKKAETTTEKRSLVGLSVSDAEDIILKVCKAMEKLQSLTTSKGVYGINDLSEADAAKVEKLKEIFEYNKNVLKAVINSSGKFHKSLYKKYAADINKAGLKYKEYMSIVENKTVRL